MRCIGIDTGAMGCICELNDAEKTARYLNLTYREDGVINGYAIERAFEGFANVHKVVIEKIHTNYGKMGEKQKAGMMKNYGQMLGLLHHVPINFVDPHRWQSRQHRGASGLTAKERSFAAFSSLNPNFGKLRKKADSGLVDAFLIARWGLEDSRVIFFDDWNFINLEE